MTRKDRKKYVSRAFQRCVLCVKSENPSDVILRHLGNESEVQDRLVNFFYILVLIRMVFLVRNLIC